jgi:hypothetical protein
VAEERFKRITKRFYCRGIDLNNPVDSVRDGYYPIIENLRSYQDGSLQPRQGITVIANVVTNQTPTHTARRLNDPLNSSWIRVIASGVALATGQAAFTRTQYNASNITLSGDPVMMVPYRPDQSPSSWMYVADSLTMRKVIGSNSQSIASGTAHQIGLPPPTAPPTVELGADSGGAIVTTLQITGATLDGVVATGVSSPLRVDNATVSITKVLLDAAVSSWGCVVPSSMAAINPNCIIQDTVTGEYVRVAETYTGTNTTTIAAISYDSGTTGLCTIQPTASSKEYNRNGVVKIVQAATTYYFRILYVVDGPNDSRCIKINTGATAITTAATSIQAVDSFRAYFRNTPADGDGIASYAQQATFAPSGSAQMGYFVIDLTGSPKDYTRNFIGNASQVSNSFLFDDDYFHISIKPDNLANVSSARIIFNCDSTETPIAQNAGTPIDTSVTKNFFYREITANDLIPFVQAQQTGIDNTTTRTNRDELIRSRKELLGGPFDRNPFEEPDPFRERGSSGTGGDPVTGPDNGIVPGDPNIFDPTSPNPRSQTGTGASQWSEIRFRKSDCIRVGTDTSRGWKAIRHVIIEFTVTASTVVAINSISCLGGSGPDIGDLGAPYQFRYRYRVAETGVASNWSPATQYGVLATRLPITAVAVAPSGAPEVNRVDFQRFGGTNTNWLNTGVLNTSSGTFTDTNDDLFVSAAAPFSDGNINFQPWPISDLPRAGTTATSSSSAAGVAGNLVRDAATNFNVSWAAGTGIIVNGVQTTVTRVISTSLLEVVDSLGSASAVAWEIPEPVILGQPLPSWWGPYDGRFFACGDSKNPGTLYWTNGNNPDSTTELNKVEITPTSEPLVNGCVYNGRNYVFSSDRMFEIVEIAPGEFRYSEVPNSKGLWSRWALTVGPKIYFLGKDGIYETVGGAPVSITDRTLFPLFPNEGNLGVTVNTFDPPNMISGQEKFHRLSYYDNYLYFDYTDTSGNYRSMVYTADSPEPGWFPDSYEPGVTFHYGEEGAGVHSILCGGSDSTTGKLYQMSGTADGATAIVWHFRSGAFDADDRRAQKLWGDFILEADPNNTTLTVALGLDNYSSTATLNATTMTGATRAQKVFDISAGVGISARNVSLDVTGSSKTATPKVYFWEPSYIYRPEDTFLRGTDWDDLGLDSDKYIMGVHITTNTGGATRTVRLEYDGGQLGTTLSINHNGYLTNPYAFIPFIARRVRFLPTDSNSWKEFKYEFVYEPEPPLVAQWGPSQQTSFGYEGFMHLREAYVMLTNTQTVTLTITRTDDGATFSYTIPAGTRKKTYLQLAPIKGKAFYLTMTSAASFRVYKDDLAFMVKPWASEQAFKLLNPFGHSHGGGEARI